MAPVAAPGSSLQSWALRAARSGATHTEGPAAEGSKPMPLLALALLGLLVPESSACSVTISRTYLGFSTSYEFVDSLILPNHSSGLASDTAGGGMVHVRVSHAGIDDDKFAGISYEASPSGDCSPDGLSLFGSADWFCTYAGLDAGLHVVTLKATALVKGGDKCQDVIDIPFYYDSAPPILTWSPNPGGRVLSSSDTVTVLGHDDLEMASLTGWPDQPAGDKRTEFDYQIYSAGHQDATGRIPLASYRGDVTLEVRGTDFADHVTDLSASFKVDVAAPSVAISTPLTVTPDGVFRAVGGIASDDIALRSVAVALRDEATGNWWDGSTFTASGAPIYRDADGVSGAAADWSYGGFNVPIPSGGAEWTVVAKAEDMVGRQATAASPVIIEPTRTIARTPHWGTENDGCHQGHANVLDGTLPFSQRQSLLPGNSPALDVSSTHHSKDPRDSVWGFGWSTEHDQTLSLSRAGVLLWADGTGSERNFFPPPTSAQDQDVYGSPLQTFSTLTVLSRDGMGVPTGARLREKDGTTLLFQNLNGTAGFFLTTLQDRNGNTLSYTRDGLGRATLVRDTHGRTLTLTYNAAGKAESVADSAGRTTSFLYDAAGNRVSETGPKGTTAYEYDAAHRITKVTHPNSGSRSYLYDAEGRVLSETNDLGGGETASSTYEYFASSTVVTDPRGKKSVYDYTKRLGLRRATRIRDAASGATSLAYDAAMNPARRTDANNNATVFEHDASGNATKVTDARQGVTDLAYDPLFGRPTGITDPNRNSTGLEYDGAGNLKVVSPPSGPPTAMDYDNQGHVTAVTDPLSRTTVMDRDAAGRVTRAEDPAHKQTQFSYDGEGNLLTATDHTGGVTTYSYGAGVENSLLTSVMDARQRLSNQKTTSFSYDKAGRLKLVTNPLGLAKSFRYDGVGNLTQTTDANGHTITFEYDDLNRLKTKTLPEGAVQYGYDANGNLTSVSHPNGSALAQSYDELDRLVHVVETLPNGHPVTLDYSYDANGNRTAVTSSMGDSFTYSYDALNRLQSVINTDGQDFRFDYDANGRRTHLTYPNGVIRADYSYDDAGQLLSIEHTRQADQTLLARSAYTYDDAGNRTSMTDLNGTHTYRYDDLHRLVEATHPPASALQSHDETFSYDHVGNRLGDAIISGYAYDDGNRLLSNSSYTFTHDNNGSATGRTDRATNEAVGLVYDSENRLARVDLPDGSVVSFKRDALGRRVEKTVFSPAAGTLTRRYVYDKEDILAILDDANSPVVTFTHGPGIDEPVGMKDQGRHRFFVADGLGSITAVAEQDGTVIERIDYTAYGTPTFIDLTGPTPVYSQASITASPLAFTGMVRDPEVGLQDNRERTYDSRSGTFLQPDPTGLRGSLNSVSHADSVGKIVGDAIHGSMNTYQYAYNSPARYTDPFGLDVMVCRRVAEIPFGRFLYRFGFPHMFIKTDTIEAGMGPLGCGPLPVSPWYGAQTQVCSNAGQSSTSQCEAISDVDEACVNAKLTIGRRTGSWTPFNQCNTFADDVIKQCRTKR